MPRISQLGIRPIGTLSAETSAFTPTGNTQATSTQGAIVEVRTELEADIIPTKAEVDAFASSDFVTFFENKLI